MVFELKNSIYPYTICINKRFDSSQMSPLNSPSKCKSHFNIQQQQIVIEIIMNGILMLIPKTPLPTYLFIYVDV